MKRLALTIAISLSTLMGIAVPRIEIPQGTAPEMDKFIADLMDKMTVEEKIGQLNLPVSGEIITGQAKNSDVAKKIEQGLVGGLLNLKGVEKIRDVQKLAVENSRLGIPLLFGMDVIHGYETIFPIPLGLSCSWDLEAIRQAARIGAIEASADGIVWTFSPMVDISRDPRWGRVSEGNGEDPFLAGAIARAMVLGYQGTDLDNQLKRNDEIMACVKHFALYGASEAGRDYNTVDMSRNRMFNEYMYPYEAAVRAGAGSVMASFNEIDGVPATANKWLMTEVLRNQWGFNGFVVTDFTGIAEMVAHGIGDLQTVSARALDAGIDMDMVSEGFVGTIKKSIEEGKVSMETLDTACRRILEAKYKLGLFADPYKYCDLTRPARDVFNKEHRAIARKTASESFVLLKNEPAKTGQAPLLPLAKKGTVAVIGPLANTRSNMPGTWSVAARLNDYPSLYEGLKEMTEGKVNVTYAKGSNLSRDAAYEERVTVFGRSLHRDSRTEKELLDEALKVAARADVIVAALGESSEMTGESSSRTDLDIPDVQRTLLEALLKTGKPVVLTLFTGRPLTLNWEQENVPAILNVWFGGSEAAYAIGDVLFGDVNPSGKLTMTFPKNVGQIPLFYNHKNTGRPLPEGKWFEKFRSNYLDVDNDPLYPFGYGLSYTTFQYGDVTLSAPEMEQDGSVTASVTVANTGKRDGAEVVQLYIRDLVGSITRPVKELKGFEKIFLKAGESKTVSFKITSDLLSFYDYDINYVCEPGDFDIMIGGGSQAVKTTRLTLLPANVQPLKVMTFNIRLDAPSDGKNNWKYRKDNVCEMISNYAPDLLGMQEVFHNQLEDMKQRLPQYTALGVGRDDGKQAGEYSPVFFNTERFTLIDTGSFAVSEHPETFGVKGWDASYNRVATWAILQEKSNGKKIAFFNTHLDNDGKVARKEGVRLILKKIKEIAPDMPAIFTGDFNCTPDEEPLQVVKKSGMQNALTAAAVACGPAWSFHDFGRLPLEERVLLDYVFVSKGMKVERYQVIQDTPGKGFLSDHYPVLVGLEYK